MIAPYRAQVNLIERSLKKLPNPMFHKVEVNTVDQYQGREMDVIICCFTKSLPKSQETTAKSDKRSDEVACLIFEACHQFQYFEKLTKALTFNNLFAYFPRVSRRSTCRSKESLKTLDVLMLL